MTCVSFLHRVHKKATSVTTSKLCCFLLTHLPGNTSLKKLLVAANVPPPPPPPPLASCQKGTQQRWGGGWGGEPEIAPESEEDEDERWRGGCGVKHAGPTLVVPAGKEGASQKDGVESMCTYNDTLTGAGGAEDLLLYRGVSSGDWEGDRTCESALYGSCTLCVEGGDRWHTWHVTGKGSKCRQVAGTEIEGSEFEGRVEEAIGRIEGVRSVDLSRNGISREAGMRIQHAFLARGSEK